MKKSSIYFDVTEDGKTTPRIDSSYYEIAHSFINTSGAKADLALNSPMSGLAKDLAIVDATNGEILNNGNDNQRTALLENYSNLRALQENPDTNPAKKGVIDEYFEAMDGNALTLLESLYNPKQANSEVLEENINEEETTDATEQAEESLKQAKDNLEQAKALSSENSVVLDKTTSKINKLSNQKSIDTKTLHAQLSSLPEIKGIPEAPTQKNINNLANNQNQAQNYIQAADAALNNLEQPK